MTKADIVNAIYADTKVDKTVIAKVLKGAMDEIKKSVGRGEPVYLRQFGSFIAKQRASKTARNIIKGTTMTIPARKVAAFKPSKEFIVNE